MVVRRFTAAGIAGLLTLLTLAIVAPSIAGATGRGAFPSDPGTATAPAARCHASIVDHAYVVSGMTVRGVPCGIARRVVRRWLHAAAPTDRIGPWRCGIRQVQPFVENGCATPSGHAISFVYTSLFG